MHFTPANFVVVVYKEELNLLALQAASAGRFIKKGKINSYTIIINGDYEICQPYVSQVVLPLFGEHREFVKIIRFDEMCHTSYPSYINQQIAKILFANENNNIDHYTCLDAKNFFIRDMLEGDVFSNGKPTARIERLNGKLQIPANEYYSDFFQIPACTREDEVLGIMTPFTIVCEIARNLIRHIEAEKSEKFSDAFNNFNIHSEFMLYFTYMLYSNINLLETYLKNNSVSTTLWRSIFMANKDVNISEYLSKENSLLAAVHRLVLRDMNDKQWADFKIFVANIGLDNHINLLARPSR